MDARAGKTVPYKSVRNEIVVNFEPERLKAPFLLRCGALLIDYILLISVPVVSLLIGRVSGVDPAKLLNSEIINAGWLIMILLALTNLVILPMFSGKSIGKFLTGLRIVNTDGNLPSFTTILIRHLIGYPITILTAGLGFLLALFNRKGRALHDLVSGTIVIYANKKTSSENLE
ncbi:MAG: RDD family protein [Pyrinomonadaceae bacterium]